MRLPGGIYVHHKLGLMWHVTHYYEGTPRSVSPIWAWTKQGAVKKRRKQESANEQTWPGTHTYVVDQLWKA